MPSRNPDHISFLGRRLPPWLQLRIVELAPGDSLAYDEAEWRGAMIVIEHGTIELESLDGSRWRLQRGASLWLFDLPLCALHNVDHETAVLSSIARRAGDAHRGP